MLTTRSIISYVFIILVKIIDTSGERMYLKQLFLLDLVELELPGYSQFYQFPLSVHRQASITGMIVIQFIDGFTQSNQSSM